MTWTDVAFGKGGGRVKVGNYKMSSEQLAMGKNLVLNKGRSCFVPASDKNKNGCDQWREAGRRK